MAQFLDWLEVAGRVATSFQVAPEGTPQRVWAEIAPWLTRFSKNAAQKWLPRILNNQTCQVPSLANGIPSPCSRHAVSTCDVCGRQVCLEHARVDHRAEAICFPCVAAAMKAARAQGTGFYGENQPADKGYEGEAGPKAPPRPQQDKKAILREAYKIIGIKQSCSDAELKSAYKKLVAKWHPDRHPEDKKAAAEERFKRIQKAYEFITAERSAQT